MELRSTIRTFGFCAATLDEDVKIQGQKNVYKEVIKTAVGGVSGVVKSVDSCCY